jgi:hypothetical protein
MNGLLTVLLATTPAFPNLDFSEGNLNHWTGEGFYLTPATGKGPSRVFGVCSSDVGSNGKKALLHRTFVVPPGAGTLHVNAFASVKDARLDIYLEAAEREIVTRYVRTPTVCEKAPQLRPPAAGGKPREYIWSIADRVGEPVRLVIADQSDEPGRHVFCGGFRIEPVNQFETTEFSKYMTALVREHKQPELNEPLLSKHFLALGNTDEKFIQSQLERCELMYQMFLNHFRVKGFKLKEPGTRLMVAIFSSQEGFEAYLGRPMPTGITGLYHPGTNRLVVYDYGRNRAVVEGKKNVENQISRLSPFDQAHVLGQMYRETDAIRTDTNISTIMHEVAHQMSFNTGLLNRDGDLPLWLAEGIATYCESTEGGFWKGIGEKNTGRLKPLRRIVAGQEEALPLRSLIESDQWLHGPGGAERALRGYAQSWAFVKMLMEEQPKSLKRYCELIRTRRTPDHRLTDFAEVFGSDLSKLEKRHRDYIKRLAQAYP